MSSKKCKIIIAGSAKEYDLSEILCDVLHQGEDAFTVEFRDKEVKKLLQITEERLTERDAISLVVRISAFKKIPFSFYAKESGISQAIIPKHQLEPQICLIKGDVLTKEYDLSIILYEVLHCDHITSELKSNLSHQLYNSLGGLINGKASDKLLETIISTKEIPRFFDASVFSSYRNKNNLICPKCGSTAVTTGARGVNWTWGLIGARKTVNRCGSCGHTWKPGK